MTYLSSASVLCGDGPCRFLTRDEQGPLIVDYGHWAPPGGRELAREMIAAHPDLQKLTDPRSRMDTD